MPVPISVTTTSTPDAVGITAADFTKELVQRAVVIQLGEEKGAAVNYLLFGGPLFPGLVDAGTLIANAKNPEDTTTDIAVECVQAAARQGVKLLLVNGIKMLPAAAENLLSATALSVVLELFKTQPLGDGTLFNGKAPMIPPFSEPQLGDLIRPDGSIGFGPASPPSSPSVVAGGGAAHEGTGPGTTGSLREVTGTTGAVKENPREKPTGENRLP